MRGGDILGHELMGEVYMRVHNLAVVGAPDKLIHEPR
jgi:hypothetical protein